MGLSYLEWHYARAGWRWVSDTVMTGWMCMTTFRLTRRPDGLFDVDARTGHKGISEHASGVAEGAALTDAVLGMAHRLWPQAAAVNGGG